MTGRLLVDGQAAIDRLEYSSDRNDPTWDRFGLDFADGGALRLRDPRRLGGVELDPDEGRLGVDAAAIGAAQLRDLLAGSEAPLKARLLDQARIAGIGNLLADEMLWRAGLDPARPAASLEPGRGAAAAPPPAGHARRARGAGRLAHGRSAGDAVPRRGRARGTARPCRGVLSEAGRRIPARGISGKVPRTRPEEHDPRRT